MTGLHDLTGLKDKFDAYKGHYDWIKGSQWFEILISCMYGELLWDFRISRVRNTSLMHIRGNMTRLQNLTSLMHIRGIRGNSGSHGFEPQV